MTDADIAATIEPILSRLLNASGLTDVGVSSGEDHEGDPALLVDLFFEGRHRAVDAKAWVSAMVEVRDALLMQGERRFPYMTPHIPDPDQDVAA